MSGSLRDKIAARQQEIARAPEHTILIGVPDYEDILVAQYRALSYREAWKIEERHEKVKDGAEQALLVAADKLIAACERMVEPTSVVNEYRDTGYKWGVKLAREEFSLELPEGTTARQALLAMFAGDEREELLVRHAAEYEEQRQARAPKVAQALEGESEASSAVI